MTTMLANWLTEKLDQDYASPLDVPAAHWPGLCRLVDFQIANANAVTSAFYADIRAELLTSGVWVDR